MACIRLGSLHPKRKHSTSAGNKYWVVFDNDKEFIKPYYYSASNYTRLLEMLEIEV